MRSAAYNAREKLSADATGQVFYFKNRPDLEHHEIMLPEGADPALCESGALWNAAEGAEKRKDAQVARELILALPANAEVSHEDRVEMARGFAIEHFVSKGVAVQLDVHAPHGAPGEPQAEGEGANWHAHLLVTTRRVEGNGLAARKARDLDPEVRRIGGRGVVTEGEAWGEAWRVHQDRWFKEHGLAVRVDADAAVPGVHLGPVRLRADGGDAAARAEELRAANEAAARDPAMVLGALTRNNATFTARELDRYLAKHLPEDERAVIARAVLVRPEVLALHDRETGVEAGRFTTREVRDQERVALADAAAVAGAEHHRAVGAAARQAARAARTLRPDQIEAFEHATAAGGLKVIEGRAGTGKSYTLSAVREAFERDGSRVVGLAPTNAVAQDMAKDGFREAGTVHSALFALKNGRAVWDRRTVVVVDEAAMLDSRVTGELVAQARRAGAKVVLAGDDRQLASIERGGLFTELRQRHGSAVIRVVERQKVQWQRQAAQDLAEGRFARAVRAFDEHGAITWSDDAGGSAAALVRRVAADIEADPEASRFVFAYTNSEVDALNVALRGLYRARGGLGPDVRLDTKHGPADFAVGDRVQFTATAKKLGIYNGNAGTITALDAATGRVTARLDGGREVAWEASSFDGFRHGYAGTIYKGQGRTLDHAYLLHSRHWRAAASYVALTRQRHGAQVFASRDVARDVEQLARQMARGEVRAASVAWATADEVRAVEPAPTPMPMPPPAPEPVRPPVPVPPAPVPPPPVVAEPEPVARGWPERALVALERAAAPTAAEAARRPPLLAARDGACGRDGLGRSPVRAQDAPEAIVAAVVNDAAVGAANRALWGALRRAYRDPEAAAGAVEALERELGGAAQAASALARRPESPGKLLGRGGWFASADALVARHFASEAAAEVGPALVRLRAAQEAVSRRLRGEAEAHRRSVAEQMERDRVELPALSARAVGTVRALLAAGAEPGWRDPPPWAPEPEPGDVERARRVAPVWEAVRRDAALWAELDAFARAAHARVSSDGVQAALHARERGGPGAGVPEDLALGACLAGVLASAALLHGCRAGFEEHVQRQRAEHAERREAARRASEAAERARLEAERARVAAEQARAHRVEPRPAPRPMSGPRPGM